MNTRTVIWVSGIVANTVEGIQADTLGRGKRILVDGYNEVQGYPNIFALGDQCLMTADPAYPQGHPQMAQVAIQQAALLAKNLKARLSGKAQRTFHYKDLGSMATIGRNRAVAEIGKQSGEDSPLGSCGSSSTCAPSSPCAIRSSSSSTGSGTM